MNRFLVPLLLAVLLGVLVVILWPSPRSAIGHTISFSDGTTLTLKAVTCGTEHYYRGGLWRRWLRFLPPKLVARFVPRGDAFTTSRPSIVFWLARRGNTQPTGDLVLCDSTGFGVWGGYTMTYRGPPRAQVEGWAFEYWPRRAPTFTLRVYERGRRWGEAQPIGEFTIRNPQFRKYPAWTAPPPPITARVHAALPFSNSHFERPTLSGRGILPLNSGAEYADTRPRSPCHVQNENCCFPSGRR